MTSAVPEKAMKLTINDIIRVHGFVMLEGLDFFCPATGQVERAGVDYCNLRKA